MISKGLNRSIVQGIMKGSVPSVQNAYKIAKLLGVPLENLLTGEDPSLPPTKKEKKGGKNGVFIPLIKGPIPPKWDRLPKDQIKEEIWIGEKYLPLKGESQDRYIAIEMKGESMEPVIRDREVLILDRKDNDPRKLIKGRPYAVGFKKSIEVRLLLFDEKKNNIQMFQANPSSIGRNLTETINLGRNFLNPILGGVLFSLKRWF